MLGLVQTNWDDNDYVLMLLILICSSALKVRIVPKSFLLLELFDCAWYRNILPLLSLFFNNRIIQGSFNGYILN